MTVSADCLQKPLLYTSYIGHKGSVKSADTLLMPLLAVAQISAGLSAVMIAVGGERKKKQKATSCPNDEQCIGRRCDLETPVFCFLVPHLRRSVVREREHFRRR